MPSGCNRGGKMRVSSTVMKQKKTLCKIPLALAILLHNFMSYEILFSLCAVSVRMHRALLIEVKLGVDSKQTDQSVEQCAACTHCIIDDEAHTEKRQYLSYCLATNFLLSILHSINRH